MKWTNFSGVSSVRRLETPVLKPSDSPLSWQTVLSTKWQWYYLDEGLVWVLYAQNMVCSLVHCLGSQHKHLDSNTFRGHCQTMPNWQLQGASSSAHISPPVVDHRLELANGQPAWVRVKLVNL